MVYVDVRSTYLARAKTEAQSDPVVACAPAALLNNDGFLQKL